MDGSAQEALVLVIVGNANEKLSVPMEAPGAQIIAVAESEVIRIAGNGRVFTTRVSPIMVLSRGSREKKGGSLRTLNTVELSRGRLLPDPILYSIAKSRRERVIEDGNGL